MEKNIENKEQELLNKFNNFITNYNKKLSFEMDNFGENTKKYDIEISYIGKKLSNFVNQFPYFCFVENKVYIPCNLNINGNNILTSDILNAIKINYSLDIFSINNNEFVKKELFQYLFETLYYNWINIGGNDIVDTNYIVDMFLNKLIDNRNIDYLYDCDLLSRNAKNNLVFVNVFNELDSEFKMLINPNYSKFSNELNLSMNKNKKSINFDYNNADSAKYHEKFNELMYKFKKLDKSFNNLLDDCFNLSKDYSKTNNFNNKSEKIRNNISKLFNKKSKSINNYDYRNDIYFKFESLDYVITDQNDLDIINDAFISNGYQEVTINVFRIPLSVISIVNIYFRQLFQNPRFDLMYFSYIENLVTIDRLFQLIFNPLFVQEINALYENDNLDLDYLQNNISETIFVIQNTTNVAITSNDLEGIPQFFTNEEIAESQRTILDIQNTTNNLVFTTTSGTTANVIIDYYESNSSSSQ